MGLDLPESFLQCIEHEREQDEVQTAQLLKSLPLQRLVQAGYAVSNLQLENIRSGIAGKLFLELGPDATSASIDRDGVRNGDIVSVQPPKSLGKQGAPACRGVVWKVSAKILTIAVDGADEEDAEALLAFPRLCVVKTSNTVVYKRLEATMRKLAEARELGKSRLVRLLLGSENILPSTTFESGLSWFNPGLNDSQRHAVQFALANEVSIVHGPPGTGKTHTLVEIVLQCVQQGERVLVCAPSNIAADTLLERLGKSRPSGLLRIGHPARLLDGTLRYSLDVLSRSGDSGAILADIHADIDAAVASTRKLRGSAKRDAWRNVKELRRELRAREHKALQQLITASSVVVATLHGSSSRELCGWYRDQEGASLFDTLVIDEVSQALEPQCWVPLMAHQQSNIKRIVLAGDNKQLPPTVKTDDSAKVKRMLETTLFDRLVKQHGETFTVMLDTQYRMNEQIMQFASDEMYGGRLIADESVRTHTLVDLPGCDTTDETQAPLVWYDTQGDDFLEDPLGVGESENDLVASRSNANEALLVRHHVSLLHDANVPAESIGVIAPYSAQVSLLKRTLAAEFPGVEVATVDGFQGREKDVIVLSLVRSNDKFEVGFLAEERRLNVAMTRPRMQLCVVGSIETLQRSRNAYLKRWADWSEDNSDLRYPDIDELL